MMGVVFCARAILSFLLAFLLLLLFLGNDVFLGGDMFDMGEVLGNVIVSGFSLSLSACSLALVLAVFNCVV